MFDSMPKPPSTASDRRAVQANHRLVYRSLAVAVQSILGIGDAHLDSARLQDRNRWLSFIEGNGAAPVNDSMRHDPELIGESLAAFVKNDSRRIASRSEGRDHALRTALSDSVTALSELVAASALFRSEANLVLNHVHDLSEQTADNAETPTMRDVASLRTLIRLLDDTAAQQRRRVNTRLATVRLELLDLPPESWEAFTTIQSSREACYYFDRYCEAAKQLGESLTCILVRQTKPDDGDVSGIVRRHFQREIDLVMRLNPVDTLVLVIDTPSAAINSILSGLADTLRAERECNGIVEAGIELVDVDSSTSLDAILSSVRLSHLPGL